MAKGRTGSGKTKGTRDSLVDAMTQLVDDTRSAVDRPSKGAVKELRKLEKRLVAARAVEIKRLAQLVAATGSKSRREVAKRTKQAGEAAQEVAALAGQIASRAASAAADAAETVGGKVGAAAAGTKVVTPRRRSSVTRPSTTPKPAPTRSPRKRTPPTDGSGPDGST